QGETEGLFASVPSGLDPELAPFLTDVIAMDLENDEDYGVTITVYRGQLTIDAMIGVGLYVEPVDCVKPGQVDGAELLIAGGAFGPPYCTHSGGVFDCPGNAIP